MTARMRKRAGFTLVECMIVVALIGIATTAAWSLYGVLAAEGRPGAAAQRLDRAREVLVEAFEEARTTPFVELLFAPENGLERPSRVPGIRLRREVEPLFTDLARVELVASFDARGEAQSLTLVGLTRGAP